MKLKTWVDAERGRSVELAKAIAVPASFVSKMANSKKNVPFALCMPIERATSGEVSRADLWPDNYLEHWPELADTHTPRAPAAIETVADVQAAIKHVEDVAVAEIKHVAEALIDQSAHDAPAWDGTTERRETDEPWDHMTERRKLGAPIDRRVSPESVAQAKFRARQGAAVKQQEGS